MYGVSDIEYICLHAALAPHYYPLKIFKIEISCFNGLYTNASTNGYTEKLNSKKKYEQMCVCMQIVEIKAYVSSKKNAYVCLQLVLCPFYVNFVVFLSFLEIICLPAGRVDICAIWRFALHKIFQIRMCVFNNTKKSRCGMAWSQFFYLFFLGCLAIVYLLQLLLFLTHFFYFSFSFQVFYDFMCVQGKMQFLPCFAYHLLNMNEINSKKSRKVHECTHFGLMLFFFMLRL